MTSEKGATVKATWSLIRAGHLLSTLTGSECQFLSADVIPCQVAAGLCFLGCNGLRWPGILPLLGVFVAAESRADGFRCPRNPPNYK